MKHIIRGVTTLSLSAIFSLVFPLKANAYLDPGTGSYILQIVLAALLGGLFAIKLFWGKIRTFFKSTFLKGRDRE